MALVDSEYAGEFAVLATWVAGLLPWSVSLLRTGQFTVVAIRFLPVRAQYIFGAGFGPLERPFLWTWDVPGFLHGSGTGTAWLRAGAWLAVAALAVYLVALAASVAFYVAEDRLTGLPVHPVRFLGASLLAVGLLVTVAGLLFLRYRTGVGLPVGGPITVALAYPLLRVPLE
ncbi:MAG: TIGR04206 family protein [Haloarculaceae archaeon]